MANVASRVQWFINSASQGNKRLKGCTEVGADDESETEAVNEVGSPDGTPQGFRDKPGPHTIELSLNELEEANPEVDWDKLKATREVFTMTRQVVSGRRRQFLDCRVSSFSTSDNADGEITGSVSIISLRRKVL